MRRLLPLLAALTPLAAQSFAEGPAFGGTRLFTEGLSTKGNPARFDLAQPGWYLGWEDGDRQPKDFKALGDRLLTGFTTPDATQAQGALTDLGKTPYAERRRAYGLAISAPGGLYFALGQEQLTGLRTYPDLEPSRLGAGLAANLSLVDVGHADIQRLVMGAGSGTEGQAYGFALRVERVRLGREQVLLNPALGGPAQAAGSALDFKGTDQSHLTATVDLGTQFTLAQGIKVALAGDRLLPRTLGGIRENPQFRAGLTLELGPTAAVEVESDVNEARRLPLPVDQRSAAAALRIAFSPTLTFRVGAERRTVDGQASTLVGASLRLRNAPLHLTFGFQFGDDRPTRALALKVDG